jgi:hypothetical protein
MALKGYDVSALLISLSICLDFFTATATRLKIPTIDYIITNAS